MKKMNIKAIVKGWTAYISRPDVPDDIATQRAEICSKCDEAEESTALAWIKDELKEIESHVCNVCHCPLSAKIRQSVDVCPLGKWK